MVVGTLYYCVTANEPPRTRAILPLGLVKHFNLDVKLGVPDEHYPSEFPARLVPSFRYSSGRILTESIPIALMLTDLIPHNGGLLGDGSEIDRAKILSWLNMLNISLMNNIATQFTMLVGRKPYVPKEYEAAGSAVKRQLQILEDYLTKNTYLVGEKLSLADLYGVPMLLRGLQFLWGPEYRAQYPAVLRWFNTVSKSPIYDGTFDDVEMTKESQKPVQQ